MDGYKWTNKDGFSWRDPSFGPWIVGKTLRVKGAAKGDPCGNGLHIGKSAAQAIGYGKFPGRLFAVRGIGDVLGQDHTKARFASVRVIEELEKPSWVCATEDFIESIARVKWFKPGRRKPRPEWKHHKTRDAARDAARDAGWDAAWDAAMDAGWDAAWGAARDAARAAALDAARDAGWDAALDAARAAAGDAAWDAAGDASLSAYYTIVGDLDFPNKAKHEAHAKARWDVWERGYGLIGDVNGVLYTYEKP